MDLQYPRTLDESYDIRYHIQEKLNQLAKDYGLRCKVGVGKKAHSLPLYKIDELYDAETYERFPGTTFCGVGTTESDTLVFYNYVDRFDSDVLERLMRDYLGRQMHKSFAKELLSCYS